MTQNDRALFSIPTLAGQSPSLEGSGALPGEPCLPGSWSRTETGECPWESVWIDLGGEG